MAENKGAARYGVHRKEFDRNRKKILKRDSICSICGQVVDKKLKFPDPKSPTIDHIIPLDKGGHPSDINNLALSHFYCNRQKSNKLLLNESKNNSKETVRNNDLPLMLDWFSL